jgi:hypothetical protein
VRRRWTVDHRFEGSDVEGRSFKASTRRDVMLRPLHPHRSGRAVPPKVLRGPVHLTSGRRVVIDSLFRVHCWPQGSRVVRRTSLCRRRAYAAGNRRMVGGRYGIGRRPARRGTATCDV